MILIIDWISEQRIFMDKESSFTITKGLIYEDYATILYVHAFNNRASKYIVPKLIELQENYIIQNNRGFKASLSIIDTASLIKSVEI